jgi:hypothetical protein
MTSAPADETSHLDKVVQQITEVEPCRRLQLVGVLLTIVFILGIAVTVLVIVNPAGEGLGSLLDEPDADVMGTVKDAEGTPISGAVVTDAESGQTSTTGVSGWYFLEEVSTGSIELRMDAEGFKSVNKRVWLERGEYVVDIVTEPGTGELDVEGGALPKAGDPESGRGVMAYGLIAVSIVVLLGAVLAFLHHKYSIVVAASLLGIITWGWFVGSAMSVLALLLLLPLRREFRDHVETCEAPWREPPPPSLPSEDTFEDDAQGAVTTPEIPSELPVEEAGQPGGREPGP